MNILYSRESYPEFTPDEFLDLLVRSTLAERRPIDEPETIRGMLENAGGDRHRPARRTSGGRLARGH